MAGQSALIFISGGVRSGKSSFAEKLAIDIAERCCVQLHYVATGQSSDREMEERIIRHKQDRRDSGRNWTTWEQPRNLAELSSSFSCGDVVLLDCLTTLLNNEFFHGGDRWRHEDFQLQVHNGIAGAIEGIAGRTHTLIVVSNEVLNGTVADHEMVFTYMRLLGQIHQTIVRKSKFAYIVESGIPILKKGRETP
ncbi:bifunctional adenosylcobinamide kinase/adenosylcobinamide-phosphate guanylyltransferase [Bacillus sp. REN3]|uniref:bifunctional adenosylcobinamide kinase/adenosylcobinamide-phosphate guanylyltransferase n=1 Tax=Bacillus sp. REN3 TaxID=2802440 RepID=UPI001AEE9FD4|nr:bifunctional adenosylcobinamide kinase/adenosylcobinamide-phosphate guanylyltransferase [Bacillus sp. REN3]